MADTGLARTYQNFVSSPIWYLPKVGNHSPGFQRWGQLCPHGGRGKVHKERHLWKSPPVMDPPQDGQRPGIRRHDDRQEVPQITKHLHWSHIQSPVKGPACKCVNEHKHQPCYGPTGILTLDRHHLALTDPQPLRRERHTHTYLCTLSIGTLRSGLRAASWRKHGEP